MKCFSCQKECHPQSKFCSNCGRSFRSKVKKYHVQENIDIESMRNESNLEYKVIRSRNFKNSMAAALFFTILIVFSGLVELGKGIPIFTIAILIIGVIVCKWLLKFSENNYYSIPHSRTPDGKHRCIWCGNLGIWKKGEYKTDLTHYHCSKCESFFYTL
jgi:hypothetical protein